jgi:hypothetical protein
MQPPPLTRASARTITEESALTHVLVVFGHSKRNNVRLALVDGGMDRVSDLRELTFGHFSQLQHAQTAATKTEVGVTKDLNMLQRRKSLLINLWCQEQDAHELSTWFNLTPDPFNTWRKDRAEASTGPTQPVASRHKQQDIGRSAFPQGCQKKCS